MTGAQVTWLAIWWPLAVINYAPFWCFNPVGWAVAAHMVERRRTALSKVKAISLLLLSIIGLTWLFLPPRGWNGGDVVFTLSAQVAAGLLMLAAQMLVMAFIKMLEDRFATRQAVVCDREAMQ